MESRNDREPCFVISVAARLVNMHPQTLRYYERVGLIEPSRSSGKIRLYSHEDIERLQHIQRLINDLGVNLAGVEVIMRMSARMAQMEREMAEIRASMEAEIERLRRALAVAQARQGNERSR
ncbi:MAG: helix-turn-helix transcriptional regulator [Dehalococcoidales bacterium]|nr:helix-turn-helix transcriptional regulator [Dehalococcoidales bacterium]